MAQRRPYRASMGSSAALEQISEDRGRGFDPYVVDAFLGLAENDPTFEGRYTPASQL